MFPDHPQKPSLTQHECRQGPQSTGRCNGGDDRDRAGSTHRITSKSAASVPPRPIIRNYTMWEPGSARLGGGRWYKSPARRSRGCRGRPPRPPRRDAAETLPHTRTASSPTASQERQGPPPHSPPPPPPPPGAPPAARAPCPPGPPPAALSIRIPPIVVWEPFSALRWP
jgi:hypothetical protein